MGGAVNLRLVGWPAPVAARLTEQFDRNRTPWLVANDDHPFTENDWVLGFFDTRDSAGQRALQQKARRASGLLRVSADVDSYCVGPIVQGRTGCLGCLDLWARDRWSHFGPPPRSPSDQASWPAAGIAWDTLCSLVVDIAGRAVSGREQWLQDRQVLFLRNDLSDSTKRSFLAHPDCALCSEAPSDPTADARFSFAPVMEAAPGTYRARTAPQSDLLRKQLVDPRIGVIRSVSESARSTLLPMTFAEFWSHDEPDRTEVGIGRTGIPSLTPSVAMLEAVERFVGFRPRGRPTVHGSYLELQSVAIDPQDFILPAPEQLQELGNRCQQYTSDLSIDWIWAHSIARNKPVLVPEQIAYYRLADADAKRSYQFVEETSNGCAIGGSNEEAALHGLLEVVERDAFLTTWYGRFAPVQLDLSDAENFELKALLARAEAFEYEVHFFDIRVGFDVPVVWVLAIDPRDDAPFKSSSAAAAHPDPEKAIVGGLTEALTSLVLSQLPDPVSLHSRARSLLSGEIPFTKQQDHIDQFAVSGGLDRLQFLFSGPGPRLLREQYGPPIQRQSPIDISAFLRRQMDDVLKVASDIIIVNQNVPFFDDLGLSCVRVLAPGLHTVTFGHQNRRVSLHRLQKAHEMLGLRGEFTREDINWLPHNFP